NLKGSLARKVEYPDRSPGIREIARDRETDAIGAAGDDDFFIAEIERHRNMLRGSPRPVTPACVVHSNMWKCEISLSIFPQTWSVRQKSMRLSTIQRSTALFDRFCRRH